MTTDGPRAVRDKLGVFNPLSLTWFDLLHMFATRPAEYATEIATVEAAGIFDCVSYYGSLATISYMDRFPDVRRPTYWQEAEQLVVDLWKRKIRSQVTLMDENMDAPGLDNTLAWNEHVDGWGALYRKHPEAFMLLRICHEGSQPDVIRLLAQRLQRQCGALVAPDTPMSPEHSVQLYGNAGFKIAGVQMDRDTGGTGKEREPFWKPYEGVIHPEGWEGELPSRIWDIEPFGPFSSGFAIFHPAEIAFLHWLSFVLGSAGTTLHDAVGMRHGGEWDRPPLFDQHRAAGWGIYDTGQGIPARYQDTPHWPEIVTALRAVKAVLLPGIANWQRWNGHWRDGNGHPEMPFQIRHTGDTGNFNFYFDTDKIFKAICASNGSQIAYGALWVRDKIPVTVVHRAVKLRQLQLGNMREAIRRPDGKEEFTVKVGETFTLYPSTGAEQAFQGEYV